MGPGTGVSQKPPVNSKARMLKNQTRVKTRLQGPVSGASGAEVLQHGPSAEGARGLWPATAGTTHRAGPRRVPYTAEALLCAPRLAGPLPCRHTLQVPAPVGAGSTGKV